jgi:hypothetical protein
VTVVGLSYGSVFCVCVCVYVCVSVCVCACVRVCGCACQLQVSIAGAEVLARMGQRNVAYSLFVWKRGCQKPLGRYV